MPAIRPLYQDPFVPLLLSEDSLPLEVSTEKQQYIKKVLDKSSSDSRFADKAFLAIMAILTHGKTEQPEITSLSPDNATIGDPTFDIHVLGKNFGAGSVIVFNGFDEPTTVVSETELTTGVNMDVWAAAAVLPVHVRNVDGVLSEPVPFTFNDSVSSTTSVQEQKQVYKDNLDKPKTDKHPNVTTVEKPQVDIKSEKK